MKRKLVFNSSNHTYGFMVDISFDGAVKEVSCEISKECFQDIFDNPPTFDQWDTIEHKAKEKFNNSNEQDRRLLTTDDFK